MPRMRVLPTLFGAVCLVQIALANPFMSFGRQLQSERENRVVYVAAEAVRENDKEEKDKKRADLLFAWVGADTGDHVAVIDYSPQSDSYGSVISRHLLPSGSNRISTTGNEPHHIAITGDGQWLVTGGLTSFLKGTDEIFVWNIDQKTKKPSFAYSLDVPGYGCTDEFVSLDSQKLSFAVSMMCNSQGTSPGAIFRLHVPTGQLTLWQSASVSLTAFNPHGFDINQNGLVSADYIDPVSLFTTSFVFRDTLRHFNLDGTLNATINMPTTNSGYMNFLFFPDAASSHLGVACSTLENVMYQVNARDNTVRPMLDLAAAITGGVRSLSVGLFHFGRTGNRMLMTFQLRYVVLIAIDPSRASARVLQTFDFCAAHAQGQVSIDFPAMCAADGNHPGSHYIRIAADEARFYLTNYFIVVGNAALPGTQSAHSFRISKDAQGEFASFDFEEQFAPDFQGGKPHGLVRGVWSGPEAFTLG